jgi:hypothetical protein
MADNRATDYNVTPAIFIKLPTALSAVVPVIRDEGGPIGSI